MSYKVISYFTTNTPYETEVLKLESSMKRLHIPFKIYPKPSEGSWTKNTQQKAKVILEALQEFNDDIVWVDADAVFERYPYFFNLLEHKEFDICCYYMHTSYNPNELLSGTLYLRNNSNVKQLVSEWIKLNATKEEWDQKTLQHLVENDFKGKITLTNLPIEYIKINAFEHHQGKVESPVITHYQLSRKYRKSSW